MALVFSTQPPSFAIAIDILQDNKNSKKIPYYSTNEECVEGIRFVEAAIKANKNKNG